MNQNRALRSVLPSPLAPIQRVLKSAHAPAHHAFWIIALSAAWLYCVARVEAHIASDIGFNGAAHLNFAAGNRAGECTQDTQQATRVQEPPVVLSDEQQKALIANLQTLSQNLATATEYNRLIEQCRAAQKESLTTERAQYVSQLLGWALCRRGERRLDLAAEFAGVGNRDQAAEILRQAREDFSATLELQPSSWRALRGQGIAAVQANTWTEAEGFFSRVIEINPRELSGWFNRAEVRFQLKQFADAAADYQQVLSQQPTDLQALTGRGLCRAALADWPGAIADHSEVYRQQPDNGSSLVNRGDAFLGQGKWAAALDDYRLATENHQLPAGWQRQAWLLAVCPDPQIRSAERAAELLAKRGGTDADDPQLLETQAAIAAARGDFAAAEKLQDQACQRLADDAAAAERLRLYKAGQAFVLPAPSTGDK
jgi:tetratricopeptide (TPR) repeat protein